jgi:small-conductance mechanosensitive channel
VAGGGTAPAVVVAALSPAIIDWPLPDPEKIPDMAIRIGLIVLVAWFAQWLLYRLVARAERIMMRHGRAGAHEGQRARTLAQILRSVVTLVVVGSAVIRVIAVLGWDVKPFLAGAGILGVALGFGAQTLVRDVIAGVFVFMEDQYGVGDLVEVNGKAATVERITVRATMLRDFNGYLYFVPNGEMKVVVNRSRGWNRHAIDVHVSIESDLDAVLDVCRRVAAELNGDPRWAPRMLDPADVWGVESLANGEAQIRTVLRTRPGPDGPETARELRRRLQSALRGAGVRIGTASVQASRLETPTVKGT